MLGYIIIIGFILSMLVGSLKGFMVVGIIASVIFVICIFGYLLGPGNNHSNPY